MLWNIKSERGLRLNDKANVSFSAEPTWGQTCCVCQLLLSHPHPLQQRGLAPKPIRQALEEWWGAVLPWRVTFRGFRSKDPSVRFLLLWRSRAWFTAFMCLPGGQEGRADSELPLSPPQTVSRPGRGGRQKREEAGPARQAGGRGRPRAGLEASLLALDAEMADFTCHSSGQGAPRQLADPDLRASVGVSPGETSISGLNEADALPAWGPIQSVRA